MSDSFLKNNISEDLSIKDIYKQIKGIIAFLRSKLLIISTIVFISSGIGLTYSFFQPNQYVAKLTFVLEEDKSNGMGLAGALGLAGSLGIDLGASGGGVFSGVNLMELMKSRRIIENTLLSSIKSGEQTTTIADYYLAKIKKVDKNKEGSNIKFPPNSNRYLLSFQQDSLLGVLHDEIAGKNGIFKVYQADKKIAIITVETKSIDEFFAKIFTEVAVKEVSDFYITTKSKKAYQNFEILQKQTDSIRAELNSAITGVAAINESTFNLNSAMLLPRTLGMKKQIDVQANTTILTQLVANLEMAKVALRKETPLIQIIDHPILPLQKIKFSKLKGVILGGFTGGFLIISTLLFNKWKRKYLV